MKNRRNFFPNLIFAAVLQFFVSGPQIQAAEADSLVVKADRLRESYRFEEALEVYGEALKEAGHHKDTLADKQIREKMLMAENGKNMTGFVYIPVVVARQMFSLEDFFLYYPLKDRSWRMTPNQLDSMSGPYSKAIYVPSEQESIYYSAPDQEGTRNIYRTTLSGGVWEVPALINEQLMSESDEIYPMVSQDGKHLYFASRGLYGVGGYDLYVSEWNQSLGDWSVPVNMGFPYSSPANDYLLVNSEDGKYTVFASDRGCPADSVYVYVLEHDSMPVRSVMTDADQLMDLSFLEPSSPEPDDEKQEIRPEMSENADMRRYLDKMATVRALRDSVSYCEKKLEEYRGRYAVMDDQPQKRGLEDDILHFESLIPQYHKRLDAAIRELQEVEMDFLAGGVVIDPESLLVEADREVSGVDHEYRFSKMNIGEPLTLEMKEEEPKFDYSFKILDVGQFAEDNTIPSGIIYQIQIFSTSAKASVKNLRGLSPVFETRSSGGRYIYRVGLFTSYSDVLAHLNKVKRAGFKSAFVVGYVDGKEKSVSEVRKIEAKRKEAEPVLYNVRIKSGEEELDSVALEGIRQQASGKDIARVEGGLIAGPFDKKEEAEALAEFVRIMGYGQAGLETVNHK